MPEQVSYTAPVTDAEFWKAVGDIFKRERLKQEKPTTAWKGTPKDKRGPSQKTVETIERGKPGKIEKLTIYALRLNLTLVWIFSEALPHESKVVSFEIEQLLRAYDESTDVSDRDLPCSVSLTRSFTDDRGDHGCRRL